MTTYKDAGVNLDTGNEFVRRVRGLTTATLTQNVIAQVGGFAGCFEIPEGYKRPVIVTSTDGVGTKLLLALKYPDRLLDIGVDLVAMVVNDIICCGARPLVFLDYYATGKIDIEQGERVLAGASDACLECGVSLIGGETAELPGLYSVSNKEFDVAGFGVGIAERDKLVDGHDTIVDGDIIIGIESSGPHSNGYSLIRKVINEAYKRPTPDMISKIMEPTHLYSNAILALLEKVEVRGIANITGGGLLENLPRVVDAWFKCVIDTSSWKHLPVFDWLQRTGSIPEEEMYRVFNMGIGMAVVVRPQDEELTLQTIQGNGFSAWKIGSIAMRKGTEPQVEIS